MTERISRTLNLIPFATYKTRIRGVADSSFNEYRPIDNKGEPVVYIANSQEGTPLTMDRGEMNFFIKKACWVSSPDGKQQAFWHLDEGINNRDLGLRDVTNDRKYFFGAKLYLRVDGQEIEAEQKSFGFDTGTYTFHYINTSDWRQKGGDWGKFSRERLIDFLSNKSKRWGWIGLDK